MHRFLLHNGEIRDTDDPLISPGQVGFMNGWGVFSTLRISGGVLFAFERHYDRMRRDANLLHVPFSIPPVELEKSLLRLAEANGAFDATLRVAVVRNKGGAFENSRAKGDSDLIAFTADLTDWGKGVRLSYLPHGRYGASPFSGTKITSWAQNLTWYETAHQRGFDEVVLLNEHGQVSECTSANIFIIDKENVWTPPLQSSGCLPGVTRAILLEEICVAGFRMGERELFPSDLENCDQVFITSTTRDLLPVLEIDGVQLHQKSASLTQFQQEFSNYRSRYIALHTGSGTTLTA